MRKVLVSACLLGKKVRYDGGSLAVADQIVKRWRAESCGSSAIYDDSFSGKKVPGMGMTAALLREHGVQVFNQDEIDQADKALIAKSVGT